MIYIDTGAFLARYLSGDQYHHEAVSLWHEIKTVRESCLTSNLVLDETFTLRGRRAGYDFAAARAEKIYASKLITILRPTRKEEIKAIELLKKYADQAVSFTDCISFVLMKNKRIRRVFSFDRYFEYAGFKRYPEK